MGKDDRQLLLGMHDLYAIRDHIIVVNFITNIYYCSQPSSSCVCGHHSHTVSAVFGFYCLWRDVVAISAE